MAATPTTARRPVTERRARMAFKKATEKLRLALKLSDRDEDAGRWHDAWDDFTGALADLAPELRLLTDARRQGVFGRGGRA